VRNILAIADKELRSYFASPIAYIMIGLFSLLFGVFFYLFLVAFVQQSEQMMQFGGGSAPNINQMMIGGLFQNTAVIILFMMPMITMRTYSEEKRSGTIVGKFIGAMGLYVAMLLVTMIYIGILFIYGNPEWRPIAAGYLGLLLMGGSFISLGLFISSVTKNQIVAGFLTFGTFLLLWVIGWFGDNGGSTLTQNIVKGLSITEHFSDFARGIVDSYHVVYYLSFITFGLFLTAKSVDMERWRG
jgi:ABC-2 type transport system permease protein